MHALLFRKSHRDSSIRSRKQARTVERLDSLRSALNQARIVPGTGLVSRTTPSDTARSVERSAITQIDPATARSVERLPQIRNRQARMDRPGSIATCSIYEVRGRGASPYRTCLPHQSPKPHHRRIAICVPHPPRRHCSTVFFFTESST